MNKEKRRVPKLRFPGFTEDWEQRKLGECVDISTGYPFDSQDFNENGEYLVITNSNIQENTPFVLNNIGNRIDLDDSLKKYILDIDDLLITMDGTVGRVAIVVDTKLVLAQRVCRIKSNEPYYIYQLLSKNNFIQSMNKISHGGTIKHISLSEISEYQAFYPKSQKERIKISSVLTNYDKLITLHQRKLKHLNFKKKALLQKLFPKNGERHPELRFPEFTDAWEQRKLGDIATFSKGNGYSKSDLTPSGDPIILYGRLYTNYETTISNVDTFVELKDKSVISQGGEVIVPASGETAEDISRASVVKNQGIIIGGDLNVIKVNHLLDPTFLALTISNGEQQKELSKRAQGKSVVHLHNSDLQEVNLTFPLLNEQKEISTLFEKMDNIITLHQRKLEHLQLQKKALLQQMFV